MPSPSWGRAPTLLAAPRLLPGTTRPRHNHMHRIFQQKCGYKVRAQVGAALRRISPASTVTAARIFSARRTSTPGQLYLDFRPAPVYSSVLHAPATLRKTPHVTRAPQTHTRSTRQQQPLPRPGNTRQKPARTHHHTGVHRTGCPRAPQPRTLSPFPNGGTHRSA